MDCFHDDVRQLLPNNDGRKLIIRWTPGHTVIQGNEAADEQAKRAAKGEGSAGTMAHHYHDHSNQNNNSLKKISTYGNFGKPNSRAHFPEPRSITKLKRDPPSI